MTVSEADGREWQRQGLLAFEVLGVHLAQTFAAIFGVGRQGGHEQGRQGQGNQVFHRGFSPGCAR